MLTVDFHVIYLNQIMMKPIGLYYSDYVTLRIML